MLDQDSLPVGKHKWLVENNACKEGKTSTEILQLSACEEEQFTCNDGKCLDIHQRCNNIEVRFYYISSRLDQNNVGDLTNHYVEGSHSNIL